MISPNHRPDPNRAISINGEFDNLLLNKISPEILKLRSDKTGSPITVYIDSPGGIVKYAETAWDLLTTRDQDYKRPHVITVATGLAASAAADMLSRGNYSIAYPQSTIHFHGTRQGFNTLTMESASDLARYLKVQNYNAAEKLHDSFFARMIFLYLSNQIKIDGLIKNEKISCIEAFANVLKENITDYSTKEIVDTGLSKYNYMLNLAERIKSKFNSLQNTSFNVDLIGLRETIDFHVEQYPSERIFTSEIDKIADEFFLSKDFFRKGESHEKLIERGAFLLGREEIEEFNTIKENESSLFDWDTLSEKEKEWVKEKTLESRLVPLWHFSLAVCRKLQESENTLDPVNAYWLGAIDEIMGSKLPCLRAMVENEITVSSTSSS